MKEVLLPGEGKPYLVHTTRSGAMGEIPHCTIRTFRHAGRCLIVASDDSFGAWPNVGHWMQFAFKIEKRPKGCLFAIHYHTPLLRNDEIVGVTYLDGDWSRQRYYLVDTKRIWAPAVIFERFDAGLAEMARKYPAEGLKNQVSK